MSICTLRNLRILQFSMHKFRILQGNSFRKLQMITLIFRKIQEKLFRLEFRKVQNSAKYNKPCALQDTHCGYVRGDNGFKYPPP